MKFNAGQIRFEVQFVQRLFILSASSPSFLIATSPENAVVTPSKKPAPTNPKRALAKKVAGNPVDEPLNASVKDSAQQIWQAGLGAFTKAQTQGSKAFEALVKEGIDFQHKTQAAAEEKITEATQKMTELASEITSKASAPWGKLEGIFEDRVANVLTKLGVPTAQDIHALIQRIDALNASVDKLSALQARPPVKAAPRKAAKKPVSPKVNPD